MGTALKVEGVERIAVLRANALGDYVFALPALDALRAAYPEASITLLGRAWHAAFLPGRPGPVDDVVVVPGDDHPAAAPGQEFGAHPWDAATPDERRTFLAEMRARRFDLAIQLHGGGRNSNPLLTGLGATLTAGLRTPDAAPLDRWIPYVYEQQEAARCLEVVGLVGAPPVTLSPRLTVTAADREAGREALPDGSGAYAVLHPGASDPRRRWPAERFAALADRLAAAGLSVVVTGTAEEAGIARAVADHATAAVSDLSGHTGLSGLVGLLAGASLVVSNDTGPMHLAIAVDTPSVGIYWVGNLINGGPLTRALHRPVVSWRRECPVCGVDCIRDACDHTASFVDEPTVDEVLAAARAVVGGRKPSTLARPMHPQAGRATI